MNMIENLLRSFPKIDMKSNGFTNFSKQTTLNGNMPMKRQIAENNQKPSSTKRTKGSHPKMDIVSFGFTVAPKNNVTKAAEKKKSPRSIVD